MTSREAMVALNMLSGIGPVRVRKMLDFFGSPEAILAASSRDLERVEGVGAKTAESIVGWQDHIDLNAEMAATEQRGIQLITQADPEYPAILRETYDSPLVLYVWGELKPEDDHGIAMVGARRHTRYGQQAARQLAFQLASAGVTIISGLARGIDTFSHEGALAAGGRTIAVIGSGLGQLYPPENMALAEKIANGNGAVVSEFPLFTRPDKKTFPIRNRVVAAWSTGLVVVECPKWSGSLITANLANDFGKPVYAVPGPIDTPTSAGCHDLIRSGATLVTCAEDILDDRATLPLFSVANASELENPALVTLSETEQQVYKLLGNQPVQMEQIAEDSQCALPELSVTLLQLEIKKLVQQLPGQHYVLR